VKVEMEAVLDLVFVLPVEPEAQAVTVEGYYI
jgi:hypothetical protein